jgi:CRP/FNR family transcriptional regulator, cyclic AMP receptor protein
MMARDRKIELLSAVPLFSACSQRELRRIGSLATVVDVEEGEVLTKEGSPGSDFFVIAEGKASVTLRKKRLATLKAGDFFGEMALIDTAPRAATVTAESPMRVYVIGGSDFSALLDQIPVVARKMLRAMAQRLREAEKAPTY